MRSASLSLLVSIVVTACSTSSGGGTDAGISDAGGVGEAGAKDGGSMTGVCGGALAASGSGPTIDFVLSTKSAFCAGSGNCDNTWLFIQRADGTPVNIVNTCTPDCGQCQPVGCPALCPAPTPVSAGGLHQPWDGRIYVASTCGPSTSALACASLECADAGHYVAKMCVYPAGDGGANGCSAANNGTMPTCTEVPFDWPMSGTVTGMIP